MNAGMNAIFSKAVLKGLRKHGYADARIGEMVGWTAAEVKAGVAGKRVLNDSM